MATIEPVSGENDMPRVRDLASSDPTRRRNNLNSVLTNLKDRPPASPLTSTQYLQLWRGLSIALYMHDSKNAISVQNLITTLANTFSTFYEKDEALAENGETSTQQLVWLSTWSAAFWETMAREWPDFDQWRINKYLLLIRLVGRETFNILLSAISSIKNTQAYESLLANQLAVLSAWPLSSRERKVPDGLRLHVLDVWFDELKKAENEAQADKDRVEETKKVQAELRERLIQPIQDLAKEALSKSVRTKAKDIIKIANETAP